MATVTGLDLYRKYGHPDLIIKQLVVWDVPPELEKGIIPHKVYCHPNMIPPLTQGFKNLIDRGFVSELKTWDGCWNNRIIRGRENDYLELVREGKMEQAIKLKSIHAWAMAFDVNAATNGLGQKPTLSAGFVKCFTDADFEWGGSWKNRPDGMHFQLATV